MARDYAEDLRYIADIQEDANSGVLRGAAAEIERLWGALRLACTPPWQTHGAKLGVVDETLLNYYLRRAAEAAKEPTP